jgi:hypothetical protein
VEPEMKVLTESHVLWDGGYALAGFSSSTDPNYNLYLVKIDSDFNFLWSEEFGGLYEDLGFDVVEDNSGNLWMLGYETVPLIQVISW